MLEYIRKTRENQENLSILPIKSAHPPTNGIRAQQIKKYGRDIC